MPSIAGKAFQNISAKINAIQKLINNSQRKNKINLCWIMSVFISGKDTAKP